MLQILSAAGALLLTALACYPTLSFIQVGWWVRMADVASSFDTQAKTLYLLKYVKCDVEESGLDADTEFEKVYCDRYGQKYLIRPLILFALCAAVPLYFLVQTALAHLVIDGTQIARMPHVQGDWHVTILPIPAAAAFVGAYLWVVVDAVYQLRRSDFRSSYLLLWAVRLAMAVPAGYALAYLATPALAPFAAFAIGAFPLDQLRLLLRQAATRQFKLSTSVDGEHDQIKRIYGIDSIAADTFQDSGITTIPQLAYCDPVRLAITTGFPFDYIADVVGQALVWDYLADKPPLIRPLGLRSSVEFKNLLDDANSTSPTSAQSMLTIDAAAAKLDMNPQAFRNVCTHIASDPVTLFLARIWQ